MKQSCKNAFLCFVFLKGEACDFGVYLGVVVMWSIRWGSSASSQKKKKHSLNPSEHTPTPPSPSLPPLSLTRCECHVVLAGTSACVAGSGGEVCLLCVTEKISPCRLIAVLFGYWHLLSLGWRCCLEGAACSLCQAIHCHGNMSHIQPRVSPRVCRTAKSPQLLQHGRKLSKLSFCFNPGMRGGVGKRVGRNRHLYEFLLSSNFENSLLPSQESVMHVKTQF